jgi:hypothetical protein
MKNTDDQQMNALIGVIWKLAEAITPSRQAGSCDATGGFVTSHTEAMMGVTAALQNIADAISGLAEAVSEANRQLKD